LPPSSMFILSRIVRIALRLIRYAMVDQRPP